MASEIDLRPGDLRDLPTMLAVFDDAVAWLDATGRSGQWGSRPWSGNPRAVARVRGLITGGELTVAEIDGASVGFLVVTGVPPSYAPPAAEPELYISLLISSRTFAGRGVGLVLLAHARDVARRRGVRLLRVDCWAGGDGRLVDYYVGAGFRPTGEFAVDGWPGQILERRV